MAASRPSLYEANFGGTDPAAMSAGEQYSALRPGSTLIAYQPNGNSSNSPKTPGRLGKSQHLQQVRSLGLIHDLQEYISSVESMAAEQKRELERVREEKRDMEKFLARAETANVERGVVDYMSSEVADLPPRMRALVEDNRGLREILKRYKTRTATLEQQVTQQHSQVLALAEANERLKQSLTECSRTPAEVEREDVLKKQLEFKTRQLENLEHSISVLRAKVDTDSRLYRQNLAAAAREKDALKRQLVAAKQAMDDRDKEMRALNMELRKTRRGAAPTRQSVMAGTYQLPGTAQGGAEEEDAEAAAAANAGSSELEPPPPPPPLEEASQALVPLPDPSPAPPAPAAEPEERIRIMLIIVRDEVIVHVPMPAAAEAPAALTLVEEQPAPAADSALLLEEVAPPGEAQEPSAESELQPQLEAQPESAPEPEVGPEQVSDPGPLLEPSPESAQEPEPGPAAEPASEPGADAEAGPMPELEPSVIGMVEEPDAMSGGAWSAPGEERTQPGAEAEGEALAEQTHEAEPAAAAEGGNGGGGSGSAPHSHSSPPMPVPYPRTAARALAARVGGVSAKPHGHPHPPHGSAAGGGGAHRKGTSGGGANGKGSGPKGNSASFHK